MMKRRLFLRTIGIAGIVMSPLAAVASLFKEKTNIMTGTILRFNKEDSVGDTFTKDCKIDYPKGKQIPVRLNYDPQKILGHVVAIDRTEGRMNVSIQFYEGFNIDELKHLNPSITGMRMSAIDEGMNHIALNYIDLTVEKNCDHGIKSLKYWT